MNNPINSLIQKSHRFHRFTQIFLGTFFFHADFADDAVFFLMGFLFIGFHGISRIFGRWPMVSARYVLLLFFVTQISQITQIFLRGDYFVPQISQIYTDFLWNLW